MFDISLSYETGKSVSANLITSAGSVQLQINMTELGATGEYVASLASESVPAGKYVVVFYEGTVKLTSTTLLWDSAREVTAVDLSTVATAAEQALIDFGAAKEVTAKSAADNAALSAALSA